MFSAIDLFLRKKWSYLFRIILLFYGIYLCSIVKINYFDWSIYLYSCLIYILIFIFLKKKNLPKLRTVFDLIFIGIILFGKDISIFHNYFLILLPFINSQNNSAKKNHKIGYLFVIILIIFLDLKKDPFSFESFKAINFNFFTPILIVFCVDIFLRFRNNLRKLNEKLFEIVDDFYGIAFNRTKTINIYAELIKQFNFFHGIKKLDIMYITCFIIKKKEKLILVNSNKTIIEYSFPDENNVINKLINENNVSNVEVIFDGEQYSNTYFTEVKGKNRKYCFLITYNKSYSSIGISSLINSLFVNDYILTPALKHLARLFEIQREVAINRYNSLKEVSSKLEYVLKANEVMHFVKGSLNNVKSALSLSELIENTHNNDDKNFLTNNFVKQRKLAKADIQNIVNRSNFILEKSKNPFEASKFVKVESTVILFHIRKKWQESFWNKKIKISGNPEKLFINNVSIDFDILDLLLINVFSNIYKYTIPDSQELEFNININSLEIIFSNLTELKNKKSETELNKLIDYYNSKNRIEISKRKSHGFVHLRIYSEALDVNSNMSLEFNKYSVKIEFKFCNNESSNI